MDAWVELPFLDAAFKRDSPTLVREHGEIVRFRLPSGTGAWLVVDHALARALLRDPRLVKARTPAPATHPLFRHLLVMDPPEHTRLRAVMSHGLALQSDEQLRAMIAANCGELVADLRAPLTSTIVDFGVQFAAPLAQSVIAAIMGMPAEEAGLIAHWTDELVRADLERPQRAETLADEIAEYFAVLGTTRKRVPPSSFYAYLMAQMDARVISAEECRALAFLLVAAGFETTAHLLTAAVFLLLQQGPLWQALADDAALADAAIEECLRLGAPLELSTARFAREDFVLADRDISAGDLVFVALAAANRDPAVFNEPNRFCIARHEVRRHLAFGGGVHACLGAAVARLQARIAVRELARAFPSLRLALEPGAAVWKPGFIMRGLERLPIRSSSSADGCE